MKRLFIVVLTLFVMCGCGESYNSNLIKKPMTLDSTYSAKDNRGFYWNYKAISELETDAAVIESSAKPEGDFKGIISGTISTINPELQDQFNSIRRDGRCPAPFLNQNAKVFFILTDKISVLNKMKSIKEGDKIHLTGYNLSYNLSTDNGMPIDMNMDNKISFVYLSKLD